MLKGGGGFWNNAARIPNRIMHAFEKDSRNKMIPPLLLKHKVHVARPHRMPPQRPQQLPHGPITRNGVRYRLNRFKPKHSLPITSQNPSPIRAFTIGVLHIVHASGVCFPNIDFHVVDGVVVHVFDGADRKEGFTAWIVGEEGAGGEEGGFVGVEGAEDGAFGCVGGFGVGEGVDEEGEAEDVGEEDEFLGEVRYQEEISR